MPQPTPADPAPAPRPAAAAFRAPTRRPAAGARTLGAALAAGAGRYLIAAVSALATLGATAALSSAAAQGASAAPTAALVKRGEYVSRAGDCVGCHSQPGAFYGGGAALETPFGKIYGPNITPDRATGIGAWSRSDFERALRQGIDEKGQFLYPAMPYTSYTKMTDADVDALWAYLRSIPPLHREVPKNTLPFPLNIRSSLAVWNSLYFKPGRFVAVGGRDAAWNRGAYLVEGLGHCDVCHSPHNLAQAREPQHHLTGAQITGWYAPDISSDPLSNVSRWSVPQLATFLKSGRSPDNTKAFGPMQEVVHDSLRYLTDADIRAIAVYLKDQPATTPTEAGRANISAQQLTNGRTVYENRCASCHQSDGRGQKGNVPALAGNSAVAAKEPWNVIMAVLYGFAPQGSWGAMGSFAGTLNDEQIADVTNYVRTAWGNHAAPDATPWTVGNWRQRSLGTAAAGNQALICPNLAPDVIQPALKAGNATMLKAADDRQTLQKVILDYTRARPQSSTADVIEALSTAYCRAATSTREPQATTEAKISEFSQQVAVALSQGDLTASRTRAGLAR
jgi:mono/diheme cytochrome c family protein